MSVCKYKKLSAFIFIFMWFQLLLTHLRRKTQVIIMRKSCFSICQKKKLCPSNVDKRVEIRQLKKVYGFNRKPLVRIIHFLVSWTMPKAYPSIGIRCVSLSERSHFLSMVVVCLISSGWFSRGPWRTPPCVTPISSPRANIKMSKRDNPLWSNTAWIHHRTNQTCISQSSRHTFGTKGWFWQEKKFLCSNFVGFSTFSCRPFVFSSCIPNRIKH